MKSSISKQLFALLLLGCGPLAANTIEEVVVTASLRGDTAMQIADSVTVVTEAEIRARAAQHFEDIILTIPNVNYASGSNRARFFQIRGIGERSQFESPINPSVGFLIDDVDFSGAGTIATLMDVKQVEVLRGPQGTRYGANALGGLINVITNDPSESRSLSLKLSAAEYGATSLGLVANSPVGERLQARLVAESHESNGYTDNEHLNRDDTNGRDELTLRGKLSWQPRDNWSVNFTLAKIDIDNGYDTFSLDNLRKTLSDEPGFDRQKSVYLSLKSVWQLDGIQVEALLNRANSDIAYGYDEDWVYDGFHPNGYSSTDHYFRERDTRSMEIRFLSNHGGKLFAGSTDWVAGLYFLNSDESLRREYTFLQSGFLNDYDFDTLAVYAQLDIALGDRLNLGIGARLEEREADYDDSEQVTFSPNYSLWGGKVSLEYMIYENTLAYVSVSRGYKAGGFNTDGTLDADLREFGEEYLIEYELGLKARLNNGRSALQIALFHDDRRDQQVKSSLLRPRPDGSTDFVDFLGNAARGTNRGIEVDVNWGISDTLRMTATAGWLVARFDSFINEFGEDLGGRDQAHAPGYMFNVSLHYEQGPWAASVSTNGKDEFFFSDRHAVKSGSFTLYNASFGYETPGWKLTLWGRNLTNKDYHVRGFGSFGNDPRKGYATEPYYQFGEPRVSGVTLELILDRQ